MPYLEFTPNLQRLVGCPEGNYPGTTVGEVLATAFGGAPRSRSYVLDDGGALRKHVQVFLNGVQIEDRTGLSDPVSGDDRVYVMQALSGG